MNYIKIIIFFLLKFNNIYSYLRKVDDIFNHDDDSFDEDLVAIANNKNILQYKNKENIFSLLKPPTYIDYIPIFKHNKYNKKYYYEMNNFRYEIKNNHPLKNCIKQCVQESAKNGAIAIISFNITKQYENNYICNGIFIHTY